MCVCLLPSPWEGGGRRVSMETSHHKPYCSFLSALHLLLLLHSSPSVPPPLSPHLPPLLPIPFLSSMPICFPFLSFPLLLSAFPFPSIPSFYQSVLNSVFSLPNPSHPLIPLLLLSPTLRFQATPSFFPYLSSPLLLSLLTSP